MSFIHQIRYQNLLWVLLILSGIVWSILDFNMENTYKLGIFACLSNFVFEMLLAIRLFKMKEENMIHIFYNRRTEPVFARWFILILGIIVLFFVILDDEDIAGWFWLSVLITKLLEHYLCQTDWDVLIENRAVYRRTFWPKPILISALRKIQINDQAELELTTDDGISTLKLDSGISVNVSEKIHEIRAKN